jgi:hypothetical protein
MGTQELLKMAHPSRADLQCLNRSRTGAEF